MHHLDTCIVIAYLNGNRKVADRLKFHFPDIAISSVVLGEHRWQKFFLSLNHYRRLISSS